MLDLFGGHWWDPGPTGFNRSPFNFLMWWA